MQIYSRENFGNFDDPENVKQRGGGSDVCDKKLQITNLILTILIILILIITLVAGGIGARRAYRRY